jgi:small subunit ribosomal protein S16
MSLKIRLQRQGKKKQPFYHIVVADSRSPRDGKYVERLGTYDPKNDHEGVNLDNNKTLEWLEKGAVPSDSCYDLLSERGIMFKKHLLRGVRKGLFAADQVEAKFEKFIADKNNAITARKDVKAASAKDAYKKRMAVETAAREAKAKAIAAKKAAVHEAAAAAAAAPTEGQADAPATETQA